MIDTQRLRLGKRAARTDRRNIALRAILRVEELPPIPDTFDCDGDSLLENPMFANDVWGDCVIAYRAHHTRRLEEFEQGICLDITDDEVLREYWKEGRATCLDPHPDRGLVFLESLKAWRNAGWTVCGHTYTIDAFAAVDWHNPLEVRAGAYLLRGLGTGMALPLSAKDQLEKGEMWTVMPGERGLWNSWGPHALYLKGVASLDPLILKFVTWGQEQLADWEFCLKHIDEQYAVVDSKDKWLGNKSPVNVEKLNQYLAAVTK